MISLLEFNFGLQLSSASMRVAASLTEYTAWISDTKIAACSFAGLCQTALVFLTAGQHGKTTTSALSWDISVLSSSARSNVPPLPRDAQLAGASRAAGLNFGQAAYSVGMRFGGTATSQVLWLSDSAVWCKVSLGVRGTVPTTITCVMDLGSSTTFVSYDGPSHSSIVQNNSPTTGSVRSQIFGIALSSADVKSAARISGSACEQSQWI